MNGRENLCFDKQDYFHVLVFYTSYFIKETENVFTYSYKNTRESLGELENCMETHSHFNFLSSQTFTRVSITVCKHGKFFRFLNYE